jgi:hypothetical protein
VKSRLTGRLAIHREQSDEADAAIRRGIVSPVLVVGASGRLGRRGASLQTRYASEAMSMSDRDDWEFAGPDDAKAEIRAAVGYLLRGATGGARGDIVQEIIAIVRQVASGLPPEQGNPLDDGLPGG